MLFRSSLEYANGKWAVYNYYNDPIAQAIDVSKKKNSKESAKTMMASLMLELNMKHPSQSASASNLNAIEDLTETIEAA